MEPQMDRIDLQPGLSLSRIVYGMWRLGDDPDTSAPHVRAKISACIAQGITSMDQADIYGGYMAEEILGEALRGTFLRNKIEIVTKCGIVAPAGRHAGARLKHYDTSRAHIHAAVEHSLQLMRIDHIDLLLVHRPDPLMDHDETGAALDEIVRSGKVRAVGVSNFRPHDLDLLQSAMTSRLVTNQIELGLTCLAPFTNGDLAHLQQRRLPVMAWSPLGGGAVLQGANAALQGQLLRCGAASGVDPAAVAVAWLLAHPARIMPIIGTNKIDRITRLAEALKVGLDRQDWFALYTAALGHEVA
jgi:predicted oxidoreductase